MTSGDVTEDATRDVTENRTVGRVSSTGPGEGVGASQWSAARNPTRRPVLRSVLTIGVVASVFLVCLLVLVGILGERLTGQVIITSALMAIIPLFVIVPTYLWLDRYEAEPTGYLVFAFLWGALVAVVGAFFLNTFGLKILVEARTGVERRDLGHVAGLPWARDAQPLVPRRPGELCRAGKRDGPHGRGRPCRRDDDG